MGPDVIPDIYLPYTRSNTRQKLALVLIPVPDWYESFYLKGTYYQYLPGMGAQKKAPITGQVWFLFLFKL